MARTQKYSEDLLLEAVIKYSEIEKGKIKATELASWAKNNIRGLEGVRDYHFMRLIKETDSKSGKTIHIKKPCTIRIEEINKARSVTECVKRNVLLNASSIDDFMEQSDYVKRLLIAETRETVDKILIKEAKVVRENKVLYEENKWLKSELSNLFEKVKVLQNKQDMLIRKVTYLMKIMDENSRKTALQQMGIEEGNIDLDIYIQNLSLNIQEVMNINKILLKHVNMHEQYPSNEPIKPNDTSLKDIIIDGLNLEGEYYE